MEEVYVKQMYEETKYCQYFVNGVKGKKRQDFANKVELS